MLFSSSCGLNLWSFGGEDSQRERIGQVRAWAVHGGGYCPILIILCMVFGGSVAEQACPGAVEVVAGCWAAAEGDRGEILFIPAAGAVIPP